MVFTVVVSCGLVRCTVAICGVVWWDVVEYAVVGNPVWCAVLCYSLVCWSLMRCTMVCCGVMWSRLVSCGGFGSLVGWFDGSLSVGLLIVWFVVGQLGGWFVGAWLVCWLAVGLLVGWMAGWVHLHPAVCGVL